MITKILRRPIALFAVAATVALCAVPARAEAAGLTGTLGAISAIDTLWVLMAAFFVFFMQAGFGMVEAGFIRSKNTCNILTKNFVDYCSASIMFFLVGYAFMFGEGNSFMSPLTCRSGRSGCSRRRSAERRRRSWRAGWPGE